MERELLYILWGELNPLVPEGGNINRTYCQNLVKKKVMKGKIPMSAASMSR